MNSKETIKKELEETYELASYVSPSDDKATKRLQTIRKKVEIALKALEQIPDSS